jgi:lipopolysaccharide export system permease protein
MLFDSTLRRDLSRTFGATLIIILTIVLTMMLIRTLGQAAGGEVSPQDVLLLLGYVGLGQLGTMLTLSLFIAVVATIGRMYKDSEMVIWFASGVSLARFAKPVLRMAWPVLLVIGVLLLFVWPWGNQNMTELRNRYEQRSDLSRVTPGVFQTSRDGRQVFFIERDQSQPTAARNVFILTNSDDKEAVTSARTGRLQNQGDQRLLVLDHGQRNESNAKTGEKTLAAFDTYRIVVQDRAARRAEERPPRAQSTLTLLRTPTDKNQGELAWRFGLLLAAGNLLLLGLGLSATNPRRASNWNLLFALLTFVVYFNLVNLTQAWVAGGRMSLAGALFGLHGTAFALALGLIWWRDNATTSARMSGAGPAKRKAAA